MQYDRKISKVPTSELINRMVSFRTEMDEKHKDWQLAVIFSKINQYYFTGTMQEGMLIIPRDDEPTYWVRRSIDRAMDESLFGSIRQMDSYRDAAAYISSSGKKLPESVFIETEIVPVAMLSRFQKYFPIQDIKSVDGVMSTIRSKKSLYELSLIEKSGLIHKKVMEDIIPGLFFEGMTEVELATKIYAVMVEQGHHGIARFAMFDTEVLLGHICFGESSLYPTYFNGPGGNYGIGSAVPFLGSRENKLKKGDLVFIDTGCGFDGYHTDKTMTYVFGSPISNEAIIAHNRCIEIQDEIAAQLTPGAIPSDIYKNTMNKLDDDFLKNFMGFGNRKVKFLGHGIGLHTDELPVIAAGFDEPITEGMVFAVEPKKGIAGVGMVGSENTFVVTKEGGKSVTGVHRGLIQI